MYKTNIESVRKYRIYPDTDVDFKLKIDGQTVYNICQEYPLGYMDHVLLPVNEEVVIEIKVIRLARK